MGALTSGCHCPWQQYQVHHHYKVCLITAITSNQGKAVRHLLFKEKRQCRAAQITSATVNALPSAESLELNNNFENDHLFLPDHTGTYADCITMVSSVLHTCGPINRPQRGRLMGGAHSTSIHKKRQYCNQLLFSSVCKH